MLKTCLVLVTIIVFYTDNCKNKFNFIILIFTMAYNTALFFILIIMSIILIIFINWKTVRRSFSL
jgi:hypothetical protein